MGTSINLGEYREVKRCRLCTGVLFETSIDLGTSALANELYTDQKSAKNAQKFPLIIGMCSSCKHIQLKHVISPSRMFSNYIYKSGVSSSFQKHFEGAARYIRELSENKGFILEIGSNDGLLLSKFKEIGLFAVGIEPSAALIEISRKNNLEVIHGFWNEKTSSELIQKYGKPFIVVANNVFAHIDDMRQATKLIQETLNEGGFFVFEVSYFGDVFEKNLFDTVYHEHMSYHTIKPLLNFFEEFNLNLVDVERIPIHGGSIRVTVTNNLETVRSKSLINLLHYESFMNYENETILIEFKNKINSKKNEVKKIVTTVKDTDFIFGYAAPAKLVTFLSVMELEEIELIAVIDDNLDKQDKFLPGSGIPIVSLSKVLTDFEQSEKTEIYCFVFAWNIGSELLEKLGKKFPSGTKVIQFMPEVSSVEL
jgi:SAM-dependent methyltransferase